MSDLKQLQRALQAHVLHGVNEIATAIEFSAAVPIATRLSIYSDAYRLRLIEALANNYPALAYVLGTVEFSKLAQAYIDQYPSQHFSIRWFGSDLATFLLSSNNHSDKPWLRELAAWEWATATAFDATDSALLTLSDLAAIAPEDWPALCFTIHPSVQRINLTSNVVALVDAYASDKAPPAAEISVEATAWCIWREDFQVRYRALSIEEAAALDAVIAGKSFSELCEILSEHMPLNNVPLQAATLLKGWIQTQWMQQNLPSQS